MRQQPSQAKKSFGQYFGQSFGQQPVKTVEDDPPEKKTTRIEIINLGKNQGGYTPNKNLPCEGNVKKIVENIEENKKKKKKKESKQTEEKKKKEVEKKEEKVKKNCSAKAKVKSQVKREEKGAESPPRSQGGRGSIRKKKKANSTPSKSNFESKREFFKNYFEVSKLGTGSGVSGQVIPNNKNCTNPLLIATHSRLTA